MSSNRRPLYLSRDKDKDILTYIEPLLFKYSFSATVRELIRDGIKLREDNLSYKVIQSNTTTFNESMQGVKLKEKEVSDLDIESRLDGL